MTWNHEEHPDEIPAKHLREARNVSPGILHSSILPYETGGSRNPVCPVPLPQSPVFRCPSGRYLLFSESDFLIMKTNGCLFSCLQGGWVRAGGSVFHNDRSNSWS